MKKPSTAGNALAPESWGVSDDVMDEVLVNLFEAITEEMGWVVLRSAHSTYVKETRDFGVSLVSLEGEVFAFPEHLANFTNANVPMAGFIDGIADWEPGDVAITNDPYSTRGTVTHMPDVHLLRPVFADGKLLCFAWAFMHASDIGGSTPGSVLLTNHEVFQEGFRMRPLKLYAGGRRNEEVWRLLLDNVRIPDTVEGDLAALVAATAIGESRLHRLLAKYGVRHAARAMASALDRTEQVTRAVLRQIPKGEYEFVDYLEDDFVSERPVRIQLVLRSDGEGGVQMDFHGTDPQVRSAINIVTGGQRHHCVVAAALMRFVMTRAESVHLNAGMIRCVDLVAPQGSIVNAVFPAAMGMRSATKVRVHDVLLGALNRAVPGSVPAAGVGQVVVTSIATSVIGGKSRVVVANPVTGGAGGGPNADGMSGCDWTTANLRNVPVEVLETETTALVHRLAVEPDSEGAGRFRGGFGLRYELSVTAPGATVIMRGKERQKFEPWGFDGGSAAGVGRNYVLRDGQGPLDLKKLTLYRPGVGDVIGLVSPGGGGYGDPLDRDPALVLNDHLDDLVSSERAESVYGVVLRDGAVDAAATERHRAALRAGRPAAGSGVRFDRGAARSEWESRVGSASREIAMWLEGLPVGLRQDFKELAFRGLEALGPGPYTAPQIADVIRRLSETAAAQSAAHARH